MTRRGERIEQQIAKRMDAAVETDAQDFASCAFKGRVADVRVPPFHNDAFVGHSAGGRIDPRRRGVTGEIERGQSGVGRHRAGRGICLQVRRVEDAVAPVFWIELDRIQTTGESTCVVEARKDRLEIDVGRERFVGLVQDVKLAVHVHDEESSCRLRDICWLGSHE